MLVFKDRPTSTFHHWEENSLIYHLFASAVKTKVDSLVHSLSPKTRHPGHPNSQCLPLDVAIPRPEHPCSLSFASNSVRRPRDRLRCSLGQTASCCRDAHVL